MIKAATLNQLVKQRQFKVSVTLVGEGAASKTFTISVKAPRFAAP